MCKKEARTKEEDEPYVFSDDFLSVVWEVKVNEIGQKTHGYRENDKKVVMKYTQILDNVVFGLWDDVLEFVVVGVLIESNEGTYYRDREREQSLCFPNIIFKLKP